MVIIYKVFAEFESLEMSERAAGQIRDRIPGIERVVSRRMNWTKGHEYNEGDDAGKMNTAANWMFTPNEFFYGGTFLPVQSGGQDSSSNDAERHYEPAVRHEHILCAEGSRESVEQAAHLLRSLGGLHVRITDAPGSYF